MRSTSVALSEMSQRSIGWIVMKHGADICCPLRLNCNNFDDLTFPSSLISLMLWFVTK